MTAALCVLVGIWIGIPIGMFLVRFFDGVARQDEEVS